MKYAVGAAPFREHAHERTRGKRLSAISSGQQGDSRPLACGRDQNVEAAGREARLDRQGAGVPAPRRQTPDAAALLFLMEDGEIAKFLRRLRFTLLRQESRTC